MIMPKELTYWIRDAVGLKKQDIYFGPYLEETEPTPEAKEANKAGASLRIGMIFKKRANKIAVFWQWITSPDEPCPTNIALRSGDLECPGDLESWYTDPLWMTDDQHADPQGRDVRCRVTSFIVRDPTEEERRQFQNIDAKSAEPLPVTEPAPEYVFRRMGDYWQVVYKADELHARNLKGMGYIHKLLSNPGHKYPASEMPPPHPRALRDNGEDAAIVAEHGTGGRAQKILEGQTPGKLREAKAILEAKLETLLQDPKPSENTRKHIEDQIDAIDNSLINCRVAKGTDGATFEPRETKKARQAVQKAIDEAIDALDNEELRKHLATTIRKGKRLEYHGGLTWET